MPDLNLDQLVNDEKNYLIDLKNHIAKAESLKGSIIDYYDFIKNKNNCLWTIIMPYQLKITSDGVTFGQIELDIPPRAIDGGNPTSNPTKPQKGSSGDCGWKRDSMWGYIDQYNTEISVVQAKYDTWKKAHEAIINFVPAVEQAAKASVEESQAKATTSDTTRKDIGFVIGILILFFIIWYFFLRKSDKKNEQK